ncbi:MAG: hypothetical protein V1865_00370 [bacterium]
MSQIKIIQTELVTQNLQDIISKYEEINPILADFLRQQDFTELSKDCLKQAVTLLLQNNQGLTVAKKIKDFYGKEHDSWNGLPILAVIKSQSFDRGLGISIKAGGALVFATDDYQQQSEVQRLKNQFIAAFQSLYLASILQVIGYETVQTEYQNGTYHLLAEEV